MRIDDTQTLGRRVRAIRAALGLTQDRLALTSNTSRRFIIELEQGKPTCHIGKVLNVLRILGARVDLAPPPGVTLTEAMFKPAEGSDGPKT
jgi:y4mF family transcriptional regulator